MDLSHRSGPCLDKRKGHFMDKLSSIQIYRSMSSVRIIAHRGMREVLVHPNELNWKYDDDVGEYLTLEECLG